jgi:hypothetical protein
MRLGLYKYLRQNPVDQWPRGKVLPGTGFGLAGAFFQQTFV